MSYTTLWEDPDGLWEDPDGLWEKIERILPPEKTMGRRGRPALPNRQVVNGILFVLRSGCQWKGLKKEWFGASSSLHARFQRWSEAGVWKKIYRAMMKYYHKQRHIQWSWQAVDSQSVSAPLGGDQTGPNPTDRAKLGSKRHLWVDQCGAPLSILITPANTNDHLVMMNLLSQPIVPRPQTKFPGQHVCADKAYDSEPLRNQLRQHNFQPHIRYREFATHPPCPTLGRGTNLILAERFSLLAGALGKKVRQLVSSHLFRLCTHSLENVLACLIYG
jgi:putative transposase